MPPLLKDLLTRTPLPEADPYYAGQSVTGIPVCGPDDSPREENRRVLVSPSNPTVYFPNDSDVSAATTFHNIDDADYRRILTATGGLLYERVLTTDDRNIPLGPGVVHLCRSESETQGRYEVFVTNNNIIDNTPAQTSVLHRVDFTFSFDEIRTIVNSGILTKDHFRVAPENESILEIYPDETNIKRIVALIDGPQFHLSATRKDRMQKAFRKFEEDLPHHGAAMQQEGLDLQKGMRTETRWSMIGMGALSVYSVLLSLGKAGPIHSVITTPFRGLWHMLNLPLDRGRGWERFWNEATIGFRYRGIATLLGIGVNMTEQARLGEFRPVADPTTPEVAAKIENTINSRHNTMSVLVEGPPGWGKEQLMRTLALRNPKTVFIQITPNGMMGGTMYRGQLEQRLTDIPREIKKARKQGRHVVLFVDEIHEAFSAGKSEESQVSLLEHWKGDLARGDLRIVGFSTPRELLKARYIAGIYNDAASRGRLSTEFQEEIKRFEKDGVRQNLELRPLLNRFQPLPLPPRPASDIVAILADKIVERKGTGFSVLMDGGALERNAALSLSPVTSEGHIPRTALALFNGVIDAITAEGEASVNVSLDMVDNYVSDNYPDIAQRFLKVGNAPDPTALFTQDHFVALIRRRCPAFFNTDGSVNGNYRSSVLSLAEMARQRWAADPAHPMTTVNGHMFPREDFVERALQEALNRLEQARHPGAVAFRSVYESGREKAGEERGVENTSEGFRETSRRMFELATKR